MQPTYLIRTFGCQMNEHDSERIGGVLMADGMTPTEDAGDARVIVLNTCAIRENADNKLYGNLGHLKPLKDANPDLRIVVSGCLAQKDQGLIQRRAPWVDVVVGTHALPHLLDLLERSRTEGPQMDVQEYTETFPSALPAARATRSVPGCRSPRAATTRAASASCRSSAAHSGRARSATSWRRSRGSSPPGSWR
jgi:tRNA-2-methylthio-N6-dimethylallyladenosine synthase